MADASPIALPLGFDQWLPAMQAAALAVLTFVQEDAPTVSAALLSAAGRLNTATAFLGCSFGIWIGDAVLYLLARFGGRPLLERSWMKRFINPAAVAESERWFGKRGSWLILSSRLIPGTRLPTYLAAGFLRIPFSRFLFATGIAVTIWTAAIFLLARSFVRELVSILERWQSDGFAWLTSISLLFVLLLVVRKASNVACRATSAGQRREKMPTASGYPGCIRQNDERKEVISRHSSAVPMWFLRWTRWEFWPAWLFYTPVFINYLWLAIRYRGFTLPTTANPGIFSGGVVGESKFTTLRDLSSTSPDVTAEAHLLAGTFETRRAVLRNLIAGGSIAYPFVLKPDIGQRGVGVKLIRTAQQADKYLRSTSAPLVCQRYAPGPHEVGIFYYRFPHQTRGRIFAITEKIFPHVTGDGVRTVEELIRADPRARFIAEKYLKRLSERKAKVLAEGEMLKLVEAGNHAQGCIFRDGMHLWSEALANRVDEISQKLNGFFVGRYDIRYVDEASLRAGKDFEIIELNGAASEATSIYDARNSLWNAYRTLFRQWELVFSIGAANRQRGSSPTPLHLLWRSWRDTVALAATCPLAD